jgi:hypothetical protein
MAYKAHPPCRRHRHFHLDRIMCVHRNTLNTYTSLRRFPNMKTSIG